MPILSPETIKKNIVDLCTPYFSTDETESMREYFFSHIETIYREEALFPSYFLCAKMLDILHARCIQAELLQKQELLKIKVYDFVAQYIQTPEILDQVVDEALKGFSKQISLDIDRVGLYSLMPWAGEVVLNVLDAIAHKNEKIKILSETLEVEEAQLYSIFNQHYVLATEKIASLIQLIREDFQLLSPDETIDANEALRWIKEGWDVFDTWYAGLREVMLKKLSLLDIPLYAEMEVVSPQVFSKDRYGLIQHHLQQKRDALKLMQLNEVFLNQAIRDIWPKDFKLGAIEVYIDNDRLDALVPIELIKRLKKDTKKVIQMANVTEEEITLESRDLAPFTLDFLGEVELTNQECVEYSQWLRVLLQHPIIHTITKDMLYLAKCAKDEKEAFKEQDAIINLDYWVYLLGGPTLFLGVIAMIEKNIPGTVRIRQADKADLELLRQIETWLPQAVQCLRNAMNILTVSQMTIRLQQMLWVINQANLMPLFSGAPITWDDGQECYQDMLYCGSMLSNIPTCLLSILSGRIPIESIDLTPHLAVIYAMTTCFSARQERVLEYAAAYRQHQEKLQAVQRQEAEQEEYESLVLLNKEEVNTAQVNTVRRCMQANNHRLFDLFLPKLTFGTLQAIQQTPEYEKSDLKRQVDLRLASFQIVRQQKPAFLLATRGLFGAPLLCPLPIGEGVEALQVDVSRWPLSGSPLGSSPYSVMS
ncbi:MAG: hypothetical protein Q8R79_01075 [Legionellaceae bacterium]|nr:hypothetical protein [Legionellaceae bacterium]